MSGFGAPRSLRQFLLKLNSRCNLACRYCYVYMHVDQSWRRQPVQMSRTTVRAAAERIGEHVRRHMLRRVDVVLHGGEPLLAGVDLIGNVVDNVRNAVDGYTETTFSVQTNGILLDEPMLELLDRNSISVGVSLDGSQMANDRHRQFSHGGGSYEAVATALERIRQRRYRHLFRGLLCTVDVANDPIAVYEGLLAFEPPRIDFLLPHGNWTNPPPARLPASVDTPYADWLIQIFDRWYGARGHVADVRLFTSIISLLLGGRSGTEAVGLDPIEYVIIETDGSIQQTDSLKTVAEGLADTGLNVSSNTFDEVLSLPGVVARRVGLDGLGEKCRSCSLVRVCGGGLYAHRYRHSEGFRNPSVYCLDQQRLIRHIRDRMLSEPVR